MGVAEAQITRQAVGAPAWRLCRGILDLVLPEGALGGAADVRRGTAVSVPQAFDA
jgi:hypothetical protein